MGAHQFHQSDDRALASEKRTFSQVERPAVEEEVQEPGLKRRIKISSDLFSHEENCAEPRPRLKRLRRYSEIGKKRIDSVEDKSPLPYDLAQFNSILTNGDQSFFLNLCRAAHPTKKFAKMTDTLQLKRAYFAVLSGEISKETGKAFWLQWLKTGGSNSKTAKNKKEGDPNPEKFDHNYQRWVSSLYEPQKRPSLEVDSVKKSKIDRGQLQSQCLLASCAAKIWWTLAAISRGEHPSQGDANKWNDHFRSSPKVLEELHKCWKKEHSKDISKINNRRVIGNMQLEHNQTALRVALTEFKNLADSPSSLGQDREGLSLIRDQLQKITQSLGLSSIYKMLSGFRLRKYKKRGQDRE
jgi:hypothetical protein